MDVHVYTCICEIVVFNYDYKSPHSLSVRATVRDFPYSPNSFQYLVPRMLKLVFHLRHSAYEKCTLIIRILFQLFFSFQTRSHIRPYVNRPIYFLWQQSQDAYHSFTHIYLLYIFL